MASKWIPSDMTHVKVFKTYLKQRFFFLTDGKKFNGKVNMT